MARQPTTTATCDTPGCDATVTYLFIDPPQDWYFDPHKGDHCPRHAEAERAREWRPFVGPIHGTKGWQSVLTNRIVYQGAAPTDPKAHDGLSSEEAK